MEFHDPDLDTIESTTSAQLRAGEIGEIEALIPMMDFFCPILEHFCPLFAQIAQMGPGVTFCPDGVSFLPRFPPPTPVLYSAVKHSFRGYVRT